MDVDLYAFFNLNVECSVKDIKRAYKDKARQLHPDKNKENPRAKEEFQQLKEYYELLHDPVSRKEYDRKWKARLESSKRHKALDEERRKLKEKLEAQEEKARLERERKRKHTATNAVADRLRQDWQRHTEQAELSARIARKRVYEEQQQAAAEANLAASTNSNTVVRVKWAASENLEAAACYTKDFLVTCLSEFGEIVTLVVGKRGTAVADFHSYTDALKAVSASEHGQVGLPSLPLQLSFVNPQRSGPHPDNRTEPSHDTSVFPNASNSSETTAEKPCSNHVSLVCF